MKREIKISEDGSHTLYIPELDEHYHSIHGAIQESMHVFIKAGLKSVHKSDISILELGFGTGLNAFLTLYHAENHKVHYTSIEKYPLKDEEFMQLNYHQFYANSKNDFLKMHQSKWGIDVKMRSGFALQKIKGDIESIDFERNFDLIYFDAFAPDIQPNLWTDEIFEKIYRNTNPEGVLVTYSAKGVVRRSLQKAGFDVQRLEGPPGKREMLRAIK